MKFKLFGKLIFSPFHRSIFICFLSCKSLQKSHQQPHTVSSLLQFDQKLVLCSSTKWILLLKIDAGIIDEASNTLFILKWHLRNFLSSPSSNSYFALLFSGIVVIFLTNVCNKLLYNISYSALCRFSSS